MLELALLIAFLMLMMRIPVGKDYIERDPRDNGTKEKFTLDHRWEFKSLDDCMEFRELRQTGWKGDAVDFYKWKEEE